MNTMYNNYKMFVNAPYVANIFNSFYINGYGSLCMAKIAHSDLSRTWVYWVNNNVTAEESIKDITVF